MGDDAYERGMRARREVLGDEHVDAAVERTSEFTADFQDLITRYAWGEIWTRPGLDRRTRSAITLTALIARGASRSCACTCGGAAQRPGGGRDQGGPPAERDLLRRAGGELGVRDRPGSPGGVGIGIRFEAWPTTRSTASSRSPRGAGTSTSSTTSATSSSSTASSSPRSCTRPTTASSRTRCRWTGIRSTSWSACPSRRSPAA